MKSEIRVLRHIQVCYDVCHFAVGFRRPGGTVLEKFEEEGIEIGKIQISAALEANLKQDRAAIKHALELLSTNLLISTRCPTLKRTIAISFNILT